MPQYGANLLYVGSAGAIFQVVPVATHNRQIRAGRPASNNVWQVATYLSNVRPDPAAEPSEWLPPDDGGDAPKSTIQVLT